MKLIALFSYLLFSTSILASESSIYDFSWLDQDKEVYVLQNRKFRKVKDFYVGIAIEKNANQAFVNSLGGTGILGFFFTENFGFEFVYNKQNGKENDTFRNVKKGGATTPFYRKVDSYSGALLMWSPFYSKINTFNKIFYYDWLFGAGLAQVKTLTNENDFLTTTDSSLTTENGMGYIWTTGLRFFVNDTVSLRLDFRGLHTNTKRPKSSSDSTKEQVWFHNYDFGAGINFAF